MPESEIKPKLNPNLGTIQEINRFLAVGLTRNRKLVIGIDV
jgi:hypothetical protein